MPQFITNQNIEIDLELASLGDRIAAFLIDSVIKVVTLIVISTILSTLLSISVQKWITLLIYVPLMFYSLIFEYFYEGQSPAKRALNIKVVKLDGSTPSIGAYLLRWMFRLIDVFLYFPGIIVMIATKNGQRIGDLAAGTTVIKIRKVGAAAAFKSIAKDDHTVTFPAVKSLNDEHIELMKKALKMRKEGYNRDGVTVLAQKIKEKLNIDSELPDVKFLYTIIADYEHIANHSF